MTAKKNLTIDKGCDFSIDIATDYDLTDFVSVCQCRKTFDDPNTISFLTDINDGSITISLSHSQTAIMQGSYVYTLDICKNDGNIYRVSEGIITVS